MGSKMRALVTGGGGFVGKALIYALQKRDYEISSLSRGQYPELKHIGIKTIQGSITDKELLIESCTEKDVVFHVAAKVEPWGNYEFFYEVNVEGTKNVIEACLAAKVKYLIFTSSASVVLDGSDIEGANESLAYSKRPLSHYAATKAMAEKLVLEANCPELKTISLRPHVIWGPGDTHIIPGILKRAEAGQLWQIGSKNYSVDTTYISNLIDAQLNALDSLVKAPAAAGKAYFITNGETVKTWEFINALIDVFGYPPIEKKISKGTALTIAVFMEFFNKIFRPGKEPSLTRFTVKELCSSHWFDISNARKDISYSPRISNAEGLKILEKLSKNIEK